MQRYIEQLIEDMHQAAAQAPADPFDDPLLDSEDAFMMEMEESEKIIEGPFELLCDVVGIPLHALPPPNKLNPEQISLLNTELEKLLISFNYYPDYPENVPALLLYNAFRSIWEIEVIRVRFGQYHIDFCDGEEENCPFPGYCQNCNLEELLIEETPRNEFDIPAKDLSGEGNSAEEDFRQIEEDFYKSKPITDSEGYIPGIHNYCDRWCERCDFTDKCRVFKMENEMKSMLRRKEEGEIDDTKEELAKKVDEFFDFDDDSKDDDMNFDLDEGFDEYLKEQSDYFSNENKVERHPMTELANLYSDNSLQWLKVRFEEQEKGFLAEVALGFADEIMEAENVVSWYSILINSKLRRALSGYYDMEYNEFAEDDMNGSAKVALIGIDRSIDAFTVLLRQLKNHRTQLKKFRNQLEELRNMAEELFPDARQFVRPGLDEL